MYYYKHPDSGYISCSSPIEGYQEVTEEEFNNFIAEKEQEQEEYPTYEELEEENARLLYELLTGEEM